MQLSWVVRKSLALVPEMVTPVIWSGTVPVLDSVTVFGLLEVPVFWGAKLRLGGVMDTAATPIPVPDSGTVCGLSGALSSNARVADLVPVWDGSKLTCTVHDVPGARFWPEHRSELIAKSCGFAPPIETELTCSDAVPVFVSVTVSGALVVARAWLPNATLPKATLPGLAWAAGAHGRA